VVMRQAAPPANHQAVQIPFTFTHSSYSLFHTGTATMVPGPSMQQATPHRDIDLNYSPEQSPTQDLDIDLNRSPEQQDST
jgi:hypothetical protein